MDIGQKVIEVITLERHLAPNTVKLDSTFEELGIDSLDGVNILFALEEQFQIDVPDAAVRDMKTVRQVVDNLTRVLHSKNGSGTSDATGREIATAPN